MAQKKSLPTPIIILMLVVILAAVCTWVLPAGQYNKLSVNNNAFILTTADGDLTLPYTQKTLDSLGLQISITKFINGDLRKSISVPGSFHKMKNSPQGFIRILQAPVKGIYDSVDIIFFIPIRYEYHGVFNTDRFDFAKPCID